MSVYITGDTHGDFSFVEQFCHAFETGKKDIMIVLGDAGLNYFADRRDEERLQMAAKLPVTIFAIHGNHEMRPEHIPTYQLIDWCGGKVWMDPEYPSLMFARDGDIYTIGKKTVLVAGGVYSVDKEYRLLKGYQWFPDEQPSDEIKSRVEQKLDEVNWKVDVVLTHTCPRRYEPTEVFMQDLDQSKVDKTTEIWLDSIEERLDYKQWYCGHFHTEKVIDKLTFLFHSVRLLRELAE